MTRNEFINEITTWSALLIFCANTGCCECDDIYTNDDKDDYINDNLSHIASNMGSWQEMRYFLEYVPCESTYYRRLEDCDEFESADELFEDYKNYVLEYMDNNEYWDDDYNEENVEEDEDLENDVPIEQEPLSIEDLIGVCNSRLHKLTTDKQTEEKNDKDDFTFVSELPF